MKAAILVIDVQTVLFDVEPYPLEADLVIEKINRLTAWGRERAMPVIFIQHEHPDSIIEHGSEGWQLQQDLQLIDGDVLVRKTTPDSFHGTDLEAFLDSQEIEHLFICGYASEFCVDTTTRTAARLGYSIDLVADAHTTHDKSHASAESIRFHHNMTLPKMLSFGVTIAATELDMLLQQYAEAHVMSESD